jgi:hypothetical protein
MLSMSGANVGMGIHATEESRTSLLDLPDELIDQILAEVKWGALAPTFDLNGLDFYENLVKNTDSIKHIRLTCRRLALRATPLLLPVAPLSISDPASVDRLEHIAAHGAFAPHVKAVHVYFHFYEAELAAAIRKLAAHLLWSRPKLLHVWSTDAASALPLPHGKTRAEWNQIFDDWEAFSHGQQEKGGEEARLEGEEETESMRILRREHAEYRRRYEAQQHLAKSFTERVAKAMAQMPRATRLVLDDDPYTPTPPWATAAPATPDWLIAPTSWATAFKLGRGSPPIEPLFTLPAAVHRAGVELTGLRIHRLRLPREFPLWLAPELREGYSGGILDPDPLPGEAEELQAACRSLRVFDFTPDYEPNCYNSDSPTHLTWPGLDIFSELRTGMYEIVEWILASKSLRHVRVDLEMVHGGIPEEMVMPSPPWPGIRSLHLQDGVLDFAGLTRFLEATAGTLTHLHLDGMYLTGRYVGPFPGTRPPFSWSAVLDLLEEHCRQSREQRGSSGILRTGAAQEPLTVRLRRPLSAEFDDMHVSEADKAYLRSLFEPHDGNDGLNRAERFIHGLMDVNPLVAVGLTPLLYP